MYCSKSLPIGIDIGMIHMQSEVSLPAAGLRLRRAHRCTKNSAPSQGCGAWKRLRGCSSDLHVLSSSKSSGHHDRPCLRASGFAIAATGLSRGAKLELKLDTRATALQRKRAKASTQFDRMFLDKKREVKGSTKTSRSLAMLSSRWRVSEQGASDRRGQ